jgi:hypothetical protein
MPPDVRKRSALPFRFVMNSGLRPNKLGIAQNSDGGLAGRPKAFRTSGGRAEAFLGKASPSVVRPLIARRNRMAKPDYTTQSCDMNVQHEFDNTESRLTETVVAECNNEVILKVQGNELFEYENGGSQVRVLLDPTLLS